MRQKETDFTTATEVLQNKSRHLQCDGGVSEGLQKRIEGRQLEHADREEIDVYDFAYDENCQNFSEGGVAERNRCTLSKEQYKFDLHVFLENDFFFFQTENLMEKQLVRQAEEERILLAANKNLIRDMVSDHPDILCKTNLNVLDTKLFRKVR